MTKERLRNYRALKREREQLAALLEELETTMYAPRSQCLSGMPSSESRSGSDKMDSLIVRHAQLEERYRAKIAELTEELHAVEAAIEALRSSVERSLLRWRYIEGLNWEEVCEKMSYSWAQTHRVHAQALRHLADETEDNNEM